LNLTRTSLVKRGFFVHDAPTIDKIVADAENNGGTLRQILYGVVESTPFQKRRGDGGFGAGKAKEEGAE
jgi:hypothetical protein